MTADAGGGVRSDLRVTTGQTTREASRHGEKTGSGKALELWFLHMRRMELSPAWGA